MGLNHKYLKEVVFFISISAIFIISPIAFGNEATIKLKKAVFSMGGIVSSSDSINASLTLGQTVVGFSTNDTISTGLGFWHILGGLAQEYMCGDANSDGSKNISDAMYILNYVFIEGDPPNPIEIADVNCDDKVNISDAYYIVNYAFSGGTAPCDTDGDEVPDC